MLAPAARLRFEGRIKFMWSRLLPLLLDEDQRWLIRGPRRARGANPRNVELVLGYLAKRLDAVDGPEQIDRGLHHGCAHGCAIPTNIDWRQSNLGLSAAAN